MQFEDRVSELLHEVLDQHSDLFLIEFQMDAQAHIRIVLDGDNGVNLEQCMTVSRHIEHQLDREENDFSLEVGSAGATSPLIHPRQFVKHIGRVLQLLTNDDQHIKATLLKTDETGIELQWKVRELKPIGKGKHTVVKNHRLDYSNIKKATVIIQFK